MNEEHTDNNYYYTSDLKIAGFILDIYPNEEFRGKLLLDEVQSAILKSIKNFTEEDMVCMYQPNSMDVAMGKAEIVAEVFNYPHQLNVNLNKAIVNLAKIFSELNNDFKFKNIVVFSNRLSLDYIHPCSKAIKINGISKLNSKISFFELGFNENVDFRKFCEEEGVFFKRIEDTSLLPSELVSLIS